MSGGKAESYIENPICRSGLQMTVLAIKPIRAARSAWRALAVWSEWRRQCRHLGQLDDQILRDIGVTRAQARREARRWLR